MNFNNDSTVFPKSKFRMCITTIKKDEDWDETTPAMAAEKQQFKIIDSKWVKGNGAQFRRDFYESQSNGENLSIQIVSQKPSKFKINQIYMLSTRDVVWVWVEE